ncbi:hypothetical protein DMUE_6040, partial [Dictyocoela muelleri]
VEVISKLNKYQDLRDSITRNRKVLSLNISDIEYDINLSNLNTTGGESSIFHDSGMFDTKRYIIMGAKSSFIHLENSKNWICDDTFKSCPANFCQLYTIIGEIR